MKSLLIILSLTVFTSLSFGQEALESDFYFLMAPSDYKLFLDQKIKGNSQSTLDDIHIKTPYSTHIRGVKVDFDYKYSVQPNNESGSYRLSARLNNLDFNIKKVVTNDVIRPDVSGAYISIPIQAECNNLRLKRVGLPIEVDANLQLVNADGKLFVKVEDVNVDVNLSWTFSMGKCSGPKDYGSVLKKEITKILKNKNYISKLITDEIQGVVGAEVKQLTKSVLKSSRIALGEDVSLQIHPRSLEFVHETGYLKLKGDLRSQMIKFPRGNVEHYRFNLSDEELSQVVESGLLISQEFLQLLNEQFHEQGVYNQTFQVQKIDGVKRLFNNRIAQFFLFRDLLKFDKKADFLFETSSKLAPQVSITGGKDGYLWFQANVRGKVDMLAPKNGEHVPYMYLNSYVKARGWMSVRKGYLNVGLYKPEMSLSYDWYKSYTSKYRISKKLRGSYLKKRLQDSVSHARVSYKLPVLDMGDLGGLTPTGLVQTEKWVQLIYQVK